MSEALVDVTYRGLEVGRRLKLTQVGPSTAYLEHGTPMPVGSRVELATDEGLTIAAVVMRVHEQVAGAELAPGMRVRAASLEGPAAGWWQTLVSVADPVIPEEQATPMPRAAVAVTAPPEARTVMMAAAAPPADDAPDQRRTVMMMDAVTYDDEAVPPAVELEADEPPEGEEEDAARTVMMDAAIPPPDDEPGAEVEAEEASASRGGNGRNPSHTIVMTAVEIKDAIGEVAGAEPPAEGTGGNGGNGDSEPDDGNVRGKRRRRRRR